MTIDSAIKAFDMLAIEPEKITKEIMMESLKILLSLKLVPEPTAKVDIVTLIKSKTDELYKKDESIKIILPDVIMCMAKLCWYISKAIRMGVTSSFMIDIKD